MRAEFQLLLSATAKHAGEGLLPNSQPIRAMGEAMHRPRSGGTGKPATSVAGSQKWEE